MILNRFGNDVYKYEKDFDAINSGKENFLLPSHASFVSGKKVFLRIFTVAMSTVDLPEEKYLTFCHF